MWLWIGLGVVVFFAVSYLLASRQYARRKAQYANLAKERAPIIEAHRPTLVCDADFDELHEQFEDLHFVRVDDFVSEETLAKLRDEAEANLDEMKRNYVPYHKQGGTLSYEKIHHQAPGCLGFFHSEALRKWVSRVVGEDVVPTADHDQSTCSLLYYVKPGDRIGWHYDHNFYEGRHFTVLLSLLNEGAGGGLSDSQLYRQGPDGEPIPADTRPNSLVLFEGAKVRHKVTPVAQGDRRMILSMTFSTDPRVGRFREIIRRVKDTAFFGLRVLWN